MIRRYRASKCKIQIFISHKGLELSHYILGPMHNEFL